MDEDKFISMIDLITQRADIYFQNALKSHPIIECNNYCIMISTKTGIDFDTVRCLVHEAIRRNMK